MERLHARPRPEAQLEALFTDGWPAFIAADRTVNQYIDRVREHFRDLELVIVDDEQLVAAGWAVPVCWTGAHADLPEGYTDSLVRAVAGHERGEPPDTLVVAAAQVHPDRRGQGLAGQLLTAFRELAEQRGYARVIAPVRPTLKARYPLIPIAQFAAWTRADGAPLDPWLRTHWRLGARVIATAPRSQTMQGSVAEWESWTGLLLPESGEYVIPEGLAVLTIDREQDLGIYVEPNVWLQHA